MKSTDKYSVYIYCLGASEIQFEFSYIEELYRTNFTNKSRFIDF